MKYLATVDGREPEVALAGAECLFQNTSKYPYHVQFLRTLPGYNGLTLGHAPGWEARHGTPGA